jgi:hypothetical protein
MPMLYGEGEGAFVRLQEEIMKHSDDHSIFAWKTTSNIYHRLLARHPADFRDCSDIVSSRHRLNRIPYSITNMGLSIELAMIPWEMDTYLVGLDCETGMVWRPSGVRVGTFLRLLPQKYQYARVLVNGLDRMPFGKFGVESITGCQ